MFCFKLLCVGATSYTAKLTNIGILVEETVKGYTDTLRKLRPRKRHTFAISIIYLGQGWASPTESHASVNVKAETLE